MFTYYHVNLARGIREETRTFKFEGEVIGQMTTLVVSSKEEESVGIPDLQCP
jgi:hypothetical protein